MKKNIMVFILILMFIPASSYAKNFEFGIAASADVVAASAEMSLQKDFGYVCFGGGITHHDEDYSVGNLLIALKTNRLSPEFRYGLGFKGLYGKVDAESGAYDDYLSVVGFWLGMDYELQASLNPLNIPIEISADLTFAPDSMSFDDSSQYLEMQGGFKLWVLENACIYLACKYTDMEFKTSSHGNWDRDDTIFLGGIRLQL